MNHPRGSKKYLLYLLGQFSSKDSNAMDMDHQKRLKILYELLKIKNPFSKLTTRTIVAKLSP